MNEIILSQVNPEVTSDDRADGTNVKKARNYLGIKGICRAINRERCYVSLRINGHKEFTTREIELIELEIKRAKGESA